MEQGQLEETLERLAAAAVQLERTLAGMEERQAQVCGDVQKIVATAEEQQEASRFELERKLAEAEQKIAALEAKGAENVTATARKTVVAEPVQMFSKGSGGAVSQMEAGSLDAALSGLSLEQRIAVKSQLMRAGLFA